MSAPPRMRTRIAKLRALEPGKSVDVRGTANSVAVAAHRALGAGCYQVRTLQRQDGSKWCRVWHLAEDQRKAVAVSITQGSEQP